MKNLFFCFLMLLSSGIHGQPTRPKYVVGDVIDTCGIVFFVEVNPNQLQHILICALKDQDSSMRWYNGQYLTTFANKDGLFSKANAAKIVTVQKNLVYAANITKLSNPPPANCVDTFPWYLPSRAELKIMYDSLAVKKGVKFAKEGYWSSVEQLAVDSSSKKPVRKAWIVDFLNGRQIANDKSNKYRVRAVKELFVF
jgi:hypothetical protein